MIRWHIFADRPIGHTRETGQAAKDSQLDIEAGDGGLFSLYPIPPLVNPQWLMDGVCAVDKAPYSVKGS